MIYDRAGFEAVLVSEGVEFDTWWGWGRSTTVRRGGCAKAYCVTSF